MAAAGGGSGGRVVALLWVVVATVGSQEPPAPTLAEVLFCQGGSPGLGLALAWDTQQLFWFDFPGSHWTPRLPHLPPLPPDLEPPTRLLEDVQLCQRLHRLLTQMVTNKIPEAKGIPVVDVFTIQPLVLGEANTLVCRVENIFPPALKITWQLNGVPVTQGVTDTHYTPTPDLAFTRFSYLLVTPTSGDIYACVVTQQGDNSSIITYWVPQDVPVPSETLVTALCGAAVALGVLLGLLGLGMALWAQRGAQG